MFNTAPVGTLWGMLRDDRGTKQRVSNQTSCSSAEVMLLSTTTFKPCFFLCVDLFQAQLDDELKPHTSGSGTDHNSTILP